MASVPKDPMWDVMLVLFVSSMAYFIFITRHEIALRQQRMMAESGVDLLPYVRYAKASIAMLYLTAAFLPITILFNTLIIYNNLSSG